MPTVPDFDATLDPPSDPYASDAGADRYEPDPDERYDRLFEQHDAGARW